MSLSPSGTDSLSEPSHDDMMSFHSANLLGLKRYRKAVWMVSASGSGGLWALGPLGSRPARSPPRPGAARAPFVYVTAKRMVEVT